MMCIRAPSGGAEPHSRSAGQRPAELERDQRKGRAGQILVGALYRCRPGPGLYSTTSPARIIMEGSGGSNQYTENSLVALRGFHGEKMVWHFQSGASHDLWDFDIAAQPVLMEVMHDGRRWRLLRSGPRWACFVLDRETGVSLFPYKERAVTASTVPGKRLRQRNHSCPAGSLGLQGLSKADA